MAVVGVKPRYRSSNCRAKYSPAVTDPNGVPSHPINFSEDDTGTRGARTVSLFAPQKYAIEYLAWLYGSPSNVTLKSIS
jgi:hypothetical protein